jgi:hypothetical protein
MSRTNDQPSLPRDEQRDLTHDSRLKSRRVTSTEPYRNANDGEEYA